MSTLMRFVYGSNVLQFEEGASYPASRPITKMQVKDRTSAGTLKIQNLGVDYRQRLLNFVDMLKTDHDALKDWFDNVVNGSEGVFEYTDERGETGTVQIVDNEFNFVENDFELFSGTLNLEYV